MADDHRAVADDYASTARETLDLLTETQTKDNALQVATVEAILAVFHQLRSMEGESIRLEGAADLAYAMDSLKGVLGR